MTSNHQDDELMSESTAPPPPPPVASSSSSSTHSAPLIRNPRDNSLRACDNCKKMRIKCVDKENPPCKRCRDRELECTFDRSAFEEDRGPLPPRKRSRAEASRDGGDSNNGLQAEVTTLREQLAEMRSLLQGMSQQQSQLAAAQAQASPFPPTPVPTAHRGSLAPHPYPPSRSSSGQAVDFHNLSPDTPHGNQTSPSFEPMLPSSSSSSTHGPPSVRPPPVATPSSSSSVPTYPLPAPRRMRLPSMSDSDHANSAATSPVRGFNGGGSAPRSAPASVPPSTTPAGPSSTQPLGPPSGPATSGPSTVPYIPEPPDFDNGNCETDHFEFEIDDGPYDDNPLEAAARSQPYRDMTVLSERATLLDEGHRLALTWMGGRDRRAVDILESDMVNLTRERLTAVWEDYGTSHTNPIDEGFCTEEEGRAMFDLFMANSHQFIPIFDLETDTFELLRMRFPFTLTVIITFMVRCQEANKEISLLHLQCIQLTKVMNHAMSMAMEMDFHNELAVLLNLGPGSSRSDLSIRRGVGDVRCWLAITKQRMEMAFGEGRPVPFLDESLDHLRHFLKLPYTTVLDSRFIVAIEFMLPRMTLHRAWYLDRIRDAPPTLMEILKVNDSLESLYHYWSKYYVEHGVGRDHFLFHQLELQRANAILQTNSLLLSGVSTRSIQIMSAERTRLLVAAMEAANFIVSTFIRGQHSDSVQFGNRYYHVGTVFAARALLRLSTLMPEHSDQYRIGSDLDALVRMLPAMPGYPLAPLLRRLVLKARRSGVLAWPLQDEDSAPTANHSAGHTAAATSIEPEPRADVSDLFPAAVNEHLQPPPNPDANGIPGVIFSAAQLWPLAEGMDLGVLE
ncbi:hypothetical protein Q8F55_008347 [Vanrija albida]|uniref:Zn(2)-C6 fungal-type domain-containing protein n=1 Tax=Vanrija albida TaxID=181172 RepID=A0ABR3PW12_9TREE